MDKSKQKRRKRRTFSKEFKAEAVRPCRLSDRNINEVAADLDLVKKAFSPITVLCRVLGVSRRRVARIMLNRGLQSRPKRRFVKATNSAHDKPIARNVLGRMFHTKAPNVAWVTDVTAIPTREGWAYLAVMIDLCIRRAVGWARRAA